MSSAVDEIYVWLKSLRDGDILSAGLANGSSPAFVPTFIKNKDPNSDRGNAQRPIIKVATNLTNVDRFGSDCYSCDVRIYITVDRDVQQSNMDSIIERIRVLYHRKDITGTTLYNYSRFQVRNIIDLEASDKELQKMVTCRTIAKKA